MAKTAVTKRYFAQIGSELIEVPADHVELHRDKGSFSTSAPVLFYKVVATRKDQTFDGTGSSWEAAEKAAMDKVPKAVSK